MTVIDPTDVVMQPRCPECGVGHPAVAVVAISYGHASCAYCDRPSTVYTNINDYRDALRRGRLKRGER